MRLLQALLLPGAIWDDIALDIITGLPKSKGFDITMVVVDGLSKATHFGLRGHPITVKCICEANYSPSWNSKIKDK